MEKLLTKEETVPIVYKGVLNSIKNLKSLMDEMNQDLELLEQNVNENWQYMTEKFGPYGRDSISLASRLEFYITDEFKNKLNYMNIKRDTYGFKIARYRSISLWMLTQLKLIKSKTNPTQIIALFESLNMVPFPVLDCHQEVSSSELAVRELHPILNLSEKEVKLRIRFKGETQSSIHTLESNSFMTASPGNPGNEDKTQVFEIINPNNDSCELKYYSRKNGFLIIED